MKNNWTTQVFKTILKEPIRDFGSFSLTNLIVFLDNGIPFLKSESIQNGYINFSKISFISDEVHKILHKSIVKEGDLLYTKIGAICRGAIYNGKLGTCNSNAATAKIRINESKADKYYILYLLLSEEVKREFEKSIISTPPRINLGDIDKLEICIPPLPQQQKIAKILSTCDAVIEKTEAAIAKYQALKQGMMHDLFTRGIDLKTGQLRPSYKDAPELYKESELGMIPLEWEVKELTYLTKLVTDGSHFSPVPQEKGLPIGNVKDMLDSTFNYDGCTKILPENFALLTRQNCRPLQGDVLLSKDGTVGKVIHFEDSQKIVLLSSIAIIRVNELISSKYLAWALRSEYFDKALYGLLSGSALKRITLTDIHKIRIPFSKSTKEQLTIADRLQTIENKLKTEFSVLSKYQKLKTGLMQDLLTGKVPVKV